MSLRHEHALHCRRCQLASAGFRPPGFMLGERRPTFAPHRVCDVRHLRIEVGLDFLDRRVDGVCTQSLTVLNDGPTTLVLDAVEMTVHQVSRAGEPLDYHHDGKRLSVELGEQKRGTELDLVIRYTARPRRGLYFLAPDDGYPARPEQVWTQGQDEDNRFWFPCFDHPHGKSTSEVVVTVPARMTALSNGVLLSDRPSDDGERRTLHYRHDVPHSSYLITLVAGQFHEKRESWEGVELRYLVAPEHAADLDRSLGRTAEMMALFSRLTGRKYPYSTYSQVCVADFIFGGMENTTATTLTDSTLHDERAHQDFSSEPLVAHELAHQWFGDLLTCRDWSEGWLNEGFATYFEILWKEHWAGRDEADYDRMVDQEAYLDEDSGRYRRAIVTKFFDEPIDLFDRHLYEKGSTVLHMLRQELGDERFWRALQHYVQKHAQGSVETRDLVRAIEEATGWNGDRFFFQWVTSPGHPELGVELSWDEKAQLVSVVVDQRQDTSGDVPLFELPLKLRFVVDGKVEERTVPVSRAHQSFLLPFAVRPTQMIVDPGNHLTKSIDTKKPIEITCNELKLAELAIDRLFAARALGKAGDLSATSALVEAMKKDRFWAVRGEAALALGKLKSSEAREAIAEAIETEAHPRARRMILRALGAFRHDLRASEIAAHKLFAGDASYFVEGESGLVLARTRAATAFDSLQELLHRPSWNDTIAASALSAFAELRDARAVAIVTEWARYGRHPAARRAAVATLGSLGADLPDERRGILEALTEYLDDPDFRVRYATVDALGHIGDRRAIGALLRCERRDLDGRVRRRAKEAVRAIDAAASQPEALGQLREAVERLEKENRELKDRVLKLETKSEPSKTTA